jgi:hypothetical protein
MLIIPEIETVLLLVPRTGSGSLYRAVQAAYPKSMLIYRHMEADGIPHGYDRWNKIGVVRDPIDRLWSLYKFLQNFDGNHDPAYIARMRKSVERSFDGWIMHNEIVFTNPYDAAHLNRYWPRYTVNHPLPENRKSQYLTLRPDLGTQIYKYTQLNTLAERLKITLGNTNKTDSSQRPILAAKTLDYLHTQFAWDFQRSA